MKSLQCFIVLSLICLTGCATGEFIKAVPPEPLKEYIGDFPSLTDSEKNGLLENSIWDATDKSIRLEGRCYSKKGTNAHYKHCFEMQGDYLVRVDHSKGRGNGGPYGIFAVDKGMRAFINEVSPRITARTKSVFSKFSAFKPEYLKHLSLRDKKFSNVDIEVTTDVPRLKAFDLSVFKKSIRLEKSNKSPLNAFYAIYEGMDIGRPKEASDRVMVKVSADEYQGRYQLRYRLSPRFIPYKKISPQVKKVITNLKFNFVPALHKMGDSNLMVQIENGEKVTLTNLSNQFIEVKAITFYYADSIYSDLELGQRVKGIPPMSSLSYDSEALLSWRRPKYLPIRSKNDKHNFGISVAYNISGSTASKNLYAVKKYSLKQLLK
jgi:hypothetical protein